MNTYKITLKQQLLTLVPFLTINGVVIVGYYLLFRSMPIDILLLLIFLFVFVVNVLPVLLLHLQYLKKNRDLFLEINTEKKLITGKNNGASFEYTFNEIETLKYYATHGHISKRGSSLWYTFDPYRFYKITFKDAKSIIVTSLMINNIENTLEQLLEIEAERKFRVVPLIY